MFGFAQFWEYTNQRIRYNENIQYLTSLSTNTLKSHPPQLCELPRTPTFRPQMSRQLERRNVFRGNYYLSSANLRLSKTKQRDYIESVSKWAHKKYKKWTTKNEYEDEQEWNENNINSVDDDDSGEYTTDSDYDSMDKLNLSLPNNASQSTIFSPIEQQHNNQSGSVDTDDTPLLFPGVVSEAMRGPKLRRKISKKGKKKKKKIQWTGNEEKRLKVCIAALMQMRFHDQLAYSGLLSSITLYMRTTLSMSASSAAIALSIWTGLCYLTPLLSAYCADAKWGRATTLVIAQYVFFCGMFLIAISTYFPVKYAKTTHILFWIGMIVVGVGFGGFKPTLSPLGADQFDAKHKMNEEQKKLAKAKRSSFFGWLYWANQVGAIIASSVIAYICQNIDFSIGWSLACIALIFAIASYYSAKNYFICVPPEGSIFGDFLKVCCVSCRARCKGKKPPILLSSDSRSVSPQKMTKSQITTISETVSLKVNDNDTTNQNMDKNENENENEPILQRKDSYNYGPPRPSMLDWAKKQNGGNFDHIFVEDIKSALNALPALIPFPVAYIIYTNLLTLVYSQGCQMDVHMFGNFIFPISSLSLISTTTIIIFVPLTEKVVYPKMNEYGGWLTVTPLKKMAMAFTTAIIAMLISGITEIVRKTKYRFPLNVMDSPCGNGLPVSDMSILWQSPQFFLLGMSRVLINTGAQDFFYTESPKSMKSTLFSLNYAVDGIGAMLGSVSIIAVNSGNSPWITNDLNDGHLEYYFFVIGAFMCLLFGLFLIFAKRYQYKEFKQIESGKKLRRK